MDNKRANPKKELAGSFYHPSYYQEKDTLSSGLADTHEQVSDSYMEGGMNTDGSAQGINHEEV
ncbi:MULTISPECIES: YozQ family protein [Bacillaceae]|uniref:YozQ family protein n=1 Tax=Bacillaceae TaxID=186817 RepID=UPI001188D23F|nr:YozQ family protein [Bacillus sp. S3]QCJ43924.1 DUF4025 domain-containing protein [Bacillus sp. S3]